MEYTNYQKLIAMSQGVFNGLLFIPDISGFTELVRSTDVLTGKRITYELLSAVIGQNNLQLNIAEVEGDAVLFYRSGTAPSLCELTEQYQLMASAFESRRKELESAFSFPLNLSLKVIAHYGAMTEYKIGPFKKLYGEVVVEAHRLLKNSINSDSYLLLTDSLLETAGLVNDEELAEHGIRSNKLCEVYGKMRNICFTYFDFSEERILKQVA
ncbi:MAG TPA: DUF2652 domain-containing protein [Chitinophagaceae bacterium]